MQKIAPFCINMDYFGTKRDGSSNSIYIKIHINTVA